MSFEAIVNLIRTEKGFRDEVPAFDKRNGNEQAKFLFLLEAPGPKAIVSGEISFENNDPTARNLKRQLEEAGIGREDIAIWNIVPWYIGNKDKTAIRSANSADVQEGIKYLEPLLKAMPNLRCIILVGGAAKQAHLYLSAVTTARIVCCHHPSARTMNSRPAANEENIKIFRHVRLTS